jgi:Flp pilus assembly protein TadD
VRLAAASQKYWLFNEVELGCRLMQGALQRDRAGADDAARFRVLLGLATMHMHRGQRDAGLPHAREALALARRLDHAEWQAMALNRVGTCLMRTGDGAPDDEACLPYLEQARDLAQTSGSAATMSAALNNIATIHFRHGRLQDAERGLRQALNVARGQGNVRSALIFLHNLVRVMVAAGDPAQARGFAVEAEALLRDVGEDVLKLELLEVTAVLASREGHHEVAARFWGYACRRYTDEGYRRPPEDEAQLQRLAAQSRQTLGDAAFDAAEAAGRALDLATAMGELKIWLEKS